MTTRGGRKVLSSFGGLLLPVPVQDGVGGGGEDRIFSSASPADQLCEGAGSIDDRSAAETDYAALEMCEKCIGSQTRAADLRINHAPADGNLLCTG
jgi:hypothetical protein